MEFYRFPPAHPRRLFCAVIAFVAVVLALPMIVQAALGDSSADVEQVTLAEPSQDWEIDVPDLYCERDYESLASIGWNCGDVSVQATLTEDAKDDATTLRRMVRALAMTSLPADAPTFDGTNGALLLADAPSSTAARGRKRITSPPSTSRSAPWRRSALRRSSVARTMYWR